MIEKVRVGVNDSATKQESHLMIEKTLLRLLRSGCLDYVVDVMAVGNNFPPRYVHTLKK